MGRLTMLRDAADRGARRVAEVLRRALWWASTPAGLGWVFAAGLLLRLWLARGGGFPFDMASFGGWADRLADGGLADFYPQNPDGSLAVDEDADFFVDYPPGYLYVLYGLGLLTQALGTGLSDFLLKLPPILADLGLAWVAILLATRLTPEGVRRRFPVAGVAAVAVLLNPAVFFVSAVWGQVDSVLALLVLGGFLLLVTGEQTFRREATGLAVLSVAIATKPQAAFVVPIVVLLLFWRHLRGAVLEHSGRGSGPMARAVVRALGRIAAGGAVAFVAAMVLFLPFRLDVAEAFRLYTDTAGGYQWTSVFAFNLWGVVGFWRPDIAEADAVRFLGVPAFYIGLGLFGAAALWVLVRAWRALTRGEHEGRVLVFGAVAVVLVGFALLTRIHDRYLFLGLVALVPFLAYRRLRWSFIGLSGLYLVNVYFPFVYYLEYVGRDAPKIEALFQTVYGLGIDSPQMKALSAGTALFCVLLAWRGWHWIETGATEAPAGRPLATAPPGSTVDAGPGRGEATEEPEAAGEGRPRWTLDLHPVGGRGALLAGIVFLVALGTRLPGLASPTGMYFDEVYHARTAGEYLQEKEVYEWTHPPLAKELMAVSLAGFGGFGVQGTGPAPEGLASGVAADGGDEAVWATRSGPDSGAVHRARFEDGCALGRSAEQAVPIRPFAVAADGDVVLVGGNGPEGPVLQRLEGGEEMWRVPLPAIPVDVAQVGGTAFAVTADGSLTSVDREGVAEPLGTGAARVAASGRDLVWVTFPDQGEVVSYGPDGATRNTVGVEGAPEEVAAPQGTERLLLALRGGGLASVDTGSNTSAGTLREVGADRFVTVADSGLAWAVEGRDVRVVEPRGMSVIGRAGFPEVPAIVLGDAAHQRVIGASEEGLACVGGRPTFGWRLGSAVFGALMAAAAALLALRVTGSLLAGGLAGFFVVFSGLAFVMSRIAMNDSFVTAFLLLAWFCALSVLYRWGSGGEERRSRPAAIGWLVATGVFAGLAVASKWVGLYAVAGIGLVYLWDAVRRGRRGILWLGGGPVRTVLLGLGAVGAVMAGIYVLSYVPYFRLGHSFSDLIELQTSMYSYHAGLTATHPYGSPWYGWLVGHRAVFLHLDEMGAGRAEIWTLGNPVVLLAGLMGLVAIGYQAWRRRAGALAIVVVGAAVQYLPWTLVSRVTFFYHYLPVIPFLAVALGWWLTQGPDRPRGPGAPKVRWTAIAAAVGATLLVFAVTLPLLDGWHVTSGYHDTVKSLLPWMF